MVLVLRPSDRADDAVMAATAAAVAVVVAVAFNWR